jgi:hypothetical protein
MPSSLFAQALSIRLERIQDLIDELDMASNDPRRYRELIDQLHREAEAFQKALITDDPA